MKLLQRTSRYQFVLAIPLVIMGTAIGYVVLSAVVAAQVDEQMEHQTQHIVQQLRKGERTFTSNAPDEFISVIPGQVSEPMTVDTAMLDPEEDEMAPWRLMRSSVRLPDAGSFTIAVGRSLVETEDLVLGVAVSMTLLLALVALGNVLLNRWLAKRLWQPFHDTLDELGRFQLDGTRSARWPKTDIEEFATLNGALSNMTAKMRSDFTAQKRFTEQAAHELQTPLAILQGKLDQLIQSPNIGEQEAGVIDGLFQARERMGRTVSNMLLLARIGNQQFPPQAIDWFALFQDQHQALQDLIAQRGIRFNLRQDQPCLLRLHPLLAEVLVSNLVRNAVQHNIPAGTVNVVLGADGFMVVNTGPALTTDPGKLFERFAKDDPTSNSTGLGLSMVKEIADQNGIQLSYGYAAGVHTLVVRGE
ncbi:MAG: HAMP domain-containing histidine kinase [Flavobacteriales bacterium]|nr:MAG: HAMP domain-containing histidine kinase [Flavobacteriales bacterium]